MKNPQKKIESDADRLSVEVVGFIVEG